LFCGERATLPFRARGKRLPARKSTIVADAIVSQQNVDRAPPCFTKICGQNGELPVGSEEKCCANGSMPAARGRAGHFSGTKIFAAVNRRKMAASQIRRLVIDQRIRMLRP
jgi:hypothetical protein